MHIQKYPVANIHPTQAPTLNKQLGKKKGGGQAPLRERESALPPPLRPAARGKHSDPPSPGRWVGAFPEHPMGDSTVVLRVLVPSLRAALRDKMAQLEQGAAAEREKDRLRIRARQSSQTAALGSAAAAALGGGGGSGQQGSGGGGGGEGGAAQSQQATVLDLDGVSCRPMANGSTKWSFRCDGMAYPARLVNLPCPVEIHRTSDHARYVKCVDVAQIVIVYEDDAHMEETEAGEGYRLEGYPSYYHSGISAPLKGVVARRFDRREHRSVVPSRAEVAAAEGELKSLIDRIGKEAGGRGKGKGKGGGSIAGSKPIEEVVDEVVEYEPWMDDNGRVPYGIEFDEKDTMATKHPEIFLDAKDLEGDRAAAEEVAAGVAKEEKKKAKKKKKKKDQEAAGGGGGGTPPSLRKGIPSLKTREAQAAQREAEIQAEIQAATAAPPGGGDKGGGEMDDVTAAAAQIVMQDTAGEDLSFLDDGLFDFNDEEDFAMDM